ncbi:hypothetical protein [Streptomyces avermitilis]|uniref:MmyB family transcriptional regulator n=2 Tax=Streptomyces avermitilis TaxID=33903 RepID=UPI003F4B6D70
MRTQDLASDGRMRRWMSAQTRMWSAPVGSRSPKALWSACRRAAQVSCDSPCPAAPAPPRTSPAPPPRTTAWRHFTHLPTRVTHTPDQQNRFETALVSDLRSSAARYPKDAHLTALITSLRSASDRFDDLWGSHAVGFHTTDSKTVHHPDLGLVTVDCDTLTIPGNDLRIAMCSAPPATITADQFALLGAIGTQALT